MGWWKNLLLNYLIIDYITIKHVTQWIEYQIPNLKVKGSNPFMLILILYFKFSYWGCFGFDI